MYTSNVLQRIPDGRLSGDHIKFLIANLHPGDFRQHLGDIFAGDFSKVLYFRLQPNLLQRRLFC